MTSPDPTELRRFWEETIVRKPGVPTSAIAYALGVSEAELIASRVGEGAVRLAPRWQDLLSALGTLGRVKAITRNAHGVIEKDGVYPGFQSFHTRSMFAGDEIDLRITLSRWASGFAYEVPGERGHRNVAFFGEDGTSIHELILGDEGDAKQFYTLVNRFQNDNQSDTQQVSPLRAQVRSMRPEVGRLRRRVSNLSLRSLLASASRAELPVAFGLGNDACVQTHFGSLQKIADGRNCVKVTDVGMEIHLCESHVAYAWIVEQPSSHGCIHALELFDADSREIASISSMRQDIAWQGMLSALPEYEE